MKILYVALIVTMTTCALAHAQTVSPIGHYSKKLAGKGEIMVQKRTNDWAVFVDAAGIPRGAGTAADCPLLAYGQMDGNTFHGEIKYNVDIGSGDKPGPDNAVDPGNNITIVFTPKSATLTKIDDDGVCGLGTGIFGRYTKDKK
jgi:hypothetical protein